MNNKNNHIDIHKHLTQEELLDYANGILSNEEMYRLELHLNECELCSDAIEGIGLLANPESVLSNFYKEVLPNQPKKNNINYLAIAASVTLIAAFGLSYWLLKSNNQTQNIAENTPVEEKNVSKKEEHSNEAASESIEIPENIIIEEEPIVENSNPIEPSTELAKPTEVATLQSNKQKTVVPSEKEEAAQPTMDLIAGNSLGNEDDQRISAPTEESLDETVEQELVQAAPMAARSSKKATGSITPLKDQKEPTPEGGINALKLFVEKNLKYPQEAIDTKTKGTVVLEVTVSANGAIKNIIIIKSVGNGCDTEAMRLITTGPKWQPAVENGVAIEEKRQVKIKFKN